MRCEWENDQRTVVVFRVRCTECRKLIGEYTMLLEWDGVGIIKSIPFGDLDTGDCFTDALCWVKYDKRYYWMGLGASSFDNSSGKTYVAKICTCVKSYEEPKLQHSEVSKGKKFIRDLCLYDYALSHLEALNGIWRFSGECPFSVTPSSQLSDSEMEILNRDIQPSPNPKRFYRWNWHENGVTIHRSPVTFTSSRLSD